jgi:REP element-mobilizing transposase RayT
VAHYDPAQHHRRSIRLKGYDYSQAGAYFVTICIENRACLLGQVAGGAVELNECGQVAHACWQWLREQYEWVDLDAFVVMPNHLHGIVVIRALDAGGSRTAPTVGAGGAGNKGLGRLIGAFKTVSTRRINEHRGTPGQSVWQRNYYEHVIRNEAASHRLRDYIAGNPARWNDDPENPAVSRDSSGR